MNVVLMDRTDPVVPARPEDRPTGLPSTHARIHDDIGGAPLVQWRGPSEFVWKRVPVQILELPAELDGLRILHLSDFHTRHYWPPAYDALLARIADDPPDLIAFTGDFVESRRDHMPAVPHVRRLVAGFRARLGCFGTLGNHDLYHFAPQLDGTNVKLLDGRRELLHLASASIELIGILGVDRSDLKDAFLRDLPPRGESTLRIVLSHFPEHVCRTRHLRPHLFLAGHTHGGQVCLPGGVPIITHTKLPRHLCRGVHRLGDTWLVVNHGLGYSGLPLRVMCPAEVVELVLRKK